MRIFIIGMVLATLTGCASWPEGSLLGGGRVTSSSANQILDHKIESLSEVDLILLLNPESNVRKAKPASYKKYMNEALRKANDAGESRRSEVQDYFILASNQRCNLYLSYIKRLSVYNNSVFGTLTTILGGAGAIVTNGESARLLSGLAGISSGTRAELNQAIFESVATSIIVPGIQQVRAARLEKIHQRREDSMSMYTVEGAIADAIQYHGACNMDAGIAQAQKSLQAFEDVGLTNFSDTLERLSLARSSSQSFLLPSNVNVTVAKTEVANFESRFKAHQKKILATNTALIKDTENYRKKLAADGELHKKATELDTQLQTILVNFSSSTGHAKSVYSDELKVQQNSVTALIYSIQKKEKALISKLMAQN